MQGMQSKSTPDERQEQRPVQRPVQHPVENPFQRPIDLQEPRGLASALNGPLEAAKRYLERQKDNESALNAMGEEDETGDGRPAWLRHWPGGVLREIEAPRQNFGPGLGDIQRDVKHSELDQRALSPIADPDRDQQSGSIPGDVSGYGLAAGPSNGYAGHSIEAAFDFETVFQFETELEAESTEDWLDLSDDIELEETGRDEMTARPASQVNSRGADAGAVDESLHGETRAEPSGEGKAAWSLAPRALGSDRNGQLRDTGQTMDAAPQAELRAASPSSHPMSGHGHGHETASGLSEDVDRVLEPRARRAAPDPRAVRAAIFRLARQSSLGQASPSSPSGEAENIGFAEVARQVWNDSTASTANPYAMTGATERGEAAEVRAELRDNGAAPQQEPALESFHDAEAGRPPRSGFASSPVVSSPLAPVSDPASTTPAAQIQGGMPQLSTFPEIGRTRVHAEPEEIRTPSGSTGSADLGGSDLGAEDREQLQTQRNKASDGFLGGLADMQGGFGEDNHELEAVHAPDRTTDRTGNGSQASFTGTSGSDVPVDLQPQGEAGPRIQPQADDRGTDTGETSPAQGVVSREPERAAARAASARDLRTAHGTAADGPALAHDAGNLLSALKLYSELLALSGVLHERHKHYAEDLKLLAARSEALIDRLLAACALAEQHARGLIETPAGHGLSGLASVSDEARIVHLGKADPVPPAEANEGRRSPATGRGSDAGVTDGVDASFAASAERNQGPSQGPSQVTPVEVTAAEVTPVQPVAAGAGELAEHSRGFPPQAAGETLNDEARNPFGSDLPNAGLAPPSPSTPDPVSISQISSNPPNPTNLVDLLTRWGSLLSMIARGPVQVKFGPQAALPIRVAEEAMERILVNLVHNSMKATKGGGAIRIGVGRAEMRRSPQNEARAKPGSRMVLTVDDSGCGMSEEQIAQALGRSLDPAGSGVRNAHDMSAPATAADLDPTYGQRSSVVREGGIRGHGMGLQIVRELVQASGGELAIYSRRGVGTRIEIQWPTVEELTVLGRIPPASVGGAGESWRGYPNERLVPRQTGTSGASFDETVLTSNRQTTGNARQGVDVGVEGAIAC